MSAQAEIMVDKVSDALSVPIQAVSTYNGQRLCYVLRGQTPEPRLVETGQFNDKFIQVVKGLSEGEQVLLHQPPIADAVLAKLIPKPGPTKPAAGAAPVAKADEGAAKSPAPRMDGDPGAAPGRVVETGAIVSAAGKPQAPGAEARPNRTASSSRPSPGDAR